MKGTTAPRTAEFAAIGIDHDLQTTQPWRCKNRA